MNNNIKTKIEEYVLGELDYLNQLSPIQEDYNEVRTNSVKNINTLVDLLQKEDINDSNVEFNDRKLENEFTKIDKEYELNIKKLECEVKKNDDNLNLENRKINSSEIKNNSDSDFKEKELNLNAKRDIELRSDRIIKVLTDTATVVVPIIFYNVWMNKGFMFEETGTYTSNTFKNLFSKFKPTK